MSTSSHRRSASITISEDATSAKPIRKTPLSQNAPTRKENGKFPYEKSTVRSTSRGRSSSPSDLNRFLSDFRKKQGPVTRVSGVVNGRSVSRGKTGISGADSEISVNHRIILENEKESGKLLSKIIPVPRVSGDANGRSVSRGKKGISDADSEISVNHRIISENEKESGKLLSKIRPVTTRVSGDANGRSMSRGKKGFSGVDSEISLNNRTIAENEKESGKLLSKIGAIGTLENCSEELGSNLNNLSNVDVICAGFEVVRVEVKERSLWRGKKGSPCLNNQKTVAGGDSLSKFSKSSKRLSTNKPVGVFEKWGEEVTLGSNLNNLRKNQGPDSRVSVDANGRSLSSGEMGSTVSAGIVGDAKVSVIHRERVSDSGSMLKLNESAKLLSKKCIEVLEISTEEVNLNANSNNVHNAVVNSESGVFIDTLLEDSSLNDPNIVEDFAKIKEKSCSSSISDVALLQVQEGDLKEKGLSEAGMGSQGGVKHSSKLQERLTFLEGKVKRIASDIKKTKEMLDTNNPDSSKVILLDIQDKIVGIEKAMGRVENASKTSKNVSNGQINVPQVDNKIVLVKGLNTDELEARLFPHHKLLRDRILKSSHEITEPSSQSKMDDKIVVPIDENPIALEFLASLNKNQHKVTTRNEEIQEMDAVETLEAHDTLPSRTFNGKNNVEINFTTNETLVEFDDQENRQVLLMEEEIEDKYFSQLNEIGSKNSTGGWFVSEGESVLLAHDDGSCTYYDITNCETKAEYKPPNGLSSNIWRDCWIIRASDADGCSGRYVVAASAGNTRDSGFCSWDFYTKEVRAFHIEEQNPTSRTVLGPLPNNNSIHRRTSLSTILPAENRQWWYKPCGHLIVSTATCQNGVKIFDIRDGEQIEKWELQRPVLAMDYSSPLQWRNRGKVVVAEAESISLWDVNSLNPQALLSVSLAGRKISSLHVNNTDAEPGGGVRQRVSSSEAEGNDGVFCTADSINILDFRNSSGIGLKIPKLGIHAHSVFSRADSVFLGCTGSKGKNQFSHVQQFSLRKQKLITAYALPESNTHSNPMPISQVWGNSNLVLGVCEMGMHVYDAKQFFTDDYGYTRKVRETVGPNDLYAPSFDYSASRAILISKDRPALWRHLS